jgi:3-phenylpropionate/trans-cinnamate dioxygenase ferredoxin subunit
MAKWVTVAKAEELRPGEYKSVEIEGELIAVFNLDGKFYAIGDVCTHDGGILTGGTVEGKVITCPRHGAQFDITTGEVVRMPAFEPVPTYKIRVEGEEVQVLFE